MPFDDQYFSSHTYKDVSFAPLSQYWWSNRFYAILARRFGERGCRLLEIGSGLGHLVGQLEATFRTFGLDLNPWAVARARQAAAATALQVASAEDLPFEDAAFGVVISKHIVEHLPRPERALAEIGRVTAPGGILILSTPNLDSLLKPWKAGAWIGYRDPTHISLKPPGDWLDLVRRSGFLPRRVFSDGFWDAPYVPHLPRAVQKVLFGSLGGLQAVSGVVFLPRQWGESIMVVARKASLNEG